MIKYQFIKIFFLSAGLMVIGCSSVKPTANTNLELPPTVTNKNIDKGLYEKTKNETKDIINNLSETNDIINNLCKLNGMLLSIVGCAENLTNTSVLFPFPPPKASTYTEIKRGLLIGQSSKEISFADLNEKLQKALSTAGYVEKSYYQIPEGFALVTRLEKINEDGSPKPEEMRWVRGEEKQQIFSISDYLKQLFTANPGYYRIIVFIVTSKPFSQDGKQTVSREEAMNWLNDGNNELSEEIAAKKFTSKHKCTALVYQFERPNSAKQETVLVTPSPVPALYQLKRSGFFRGLQ
jgi:hypothetical protein